MTLARYDVLGIGNAIVDVLAHADDGFLAAHGIVKGAMTLLDAAHAERLYDAMPPGVEVSGGSAANTVVGVASLGGRAAYIGKVRNDQLGAVFAHDIRAAGVEFRVAPATEGPSTARSLILVTPDAQRSMNTFLGISAEFEPADLDETLIATAAITFLEGYLFDRDPAKRAFFEGARLAHKHHRRVALTLSDPFCVARHRGAFRELIESEIDIVFANEAEILSLYEVKSFDAALECVRKECMLAALTRSEKGSVIVSADEVHVIDAARVGDVIDTTGAGDLYAAGVLFGLARDLDLRTCGQLGSLAAAEVISHLGPRPETSLRKLVTKTGLLPA